MGLFSAIPTVLATVGAAVAMELRRVSEVQAAVVAHRTADLTAPALVPEQNPS
jgi:hypothetical protein